MQTGRVEFLKRTLIVVAVALVPILIWYLFGVILMAFGAVIVAMLVRLGAQGKQIVTFPPLWPARKRRNYRQMDTSRWAVKTRRLTTSRNGASIGIPRRARPTG